MPHTDPYTDKTDVEVLELARAALTKEAALPPGSIERAVQGMKFDSAMMELRRRAVRYGMARLRERHEG